MGTNANGVTGSGAVRRSLGRRLAALRLAAGKTPADVANTKLASRQKLWRIEKGMNSVKTGDVRGLCWFYGADTETTNQLADLALMTLEETVYEEYKDVMPSWFGLYVELESAASVIGTYQPDLVPGLLQTPEYARAVFQATRPMISTDAIERHLVSRSQRAENVLGSASTLRIKAVLSEAVLVREVGGRETMEAQVAHLRTFADADRVHVRVLTWETGAHAAMEGPFSLLEFADPHEPTIAYQENRAGARYLERPEQVAGYLEMFSAITEQSVSIKEYMP